MVKESGRVFALSYADAKQMAYVLYPAVVRLGETCQQGAAVLIDELIQAQGPRQGEFGWRRL